MKSFKTLCLLAAVFCLLLSGCLIHKAVQQARQAADAALTVAEFELCSAATVGAIKRKYGNDKSKVLAWQELCRDTGTPIYPMSEGELK